MQLKGPDRDRLQIDSRFFQFIEMSPADVRARALFCQMIAEISRGLIQADRAAREKARRAWKSGEGPEKGAAFPTARSERPKPRLKPDAITLAAIDADQLTSLDGEGSSELLPTQGGKKKSGGVLKRLFQGRK